LIEVNATGAHSIATDYGFFALSAARPARRHAMTSILQQPGEAAIHQLIAERAYQIWESQNRPRVYEVVNWRQAEQEVIAMLAETAPARSGRHTRLSDGLMLNTRP
jgi:hypothetical protein